MKDPMLVAKAESLPQPLPVRGATWIPRHLVTGAVFGLAMFLIQSLPIWGAWVKLRWFSGPSNVEPLFQTQNHDTFQYLAFITMAKDHILFPDLHAPWATEPAMWNPLFLVSGRFAAFLNVSPVAALNVLTAFAFIFAGIAFFAALQAIFPTRAQRIAAIVVTACCLPIWMFLFGLTRFIFPNTNPLFLAGVQDFAFSGDGLMRGGQFIGPTQSFGTACALLALTFTVLRLKTGSRSYVWAAASMMLLNALVHPFEVFVMAPAAMLSLILLERAWREAAIIVAAAGAGILPSVYLMLNHQWLREHSQTLSGDLNIGTMIATYGIGFLAVPYFFLLGAKLPEKTDKALFIAWFTTGALSLIPGAPFPLHLWNGFAALTGMLVVHLATQPKFALIFKQSRRLCLGMAGVLLVLNSVALGGFFIQAVREAASTKEAILFPGVMNKAQLAVADRMRQEIQSGRAGINDLALAPEPLSLLLATVPMHSFASHPNLDYQHGAQLLESGRFYEGAFTPGEATQFIKKYGFRWILIPNDSGALKYFGTREAAFAEGGYQAFFLPENQMRQYPGIENILALSERHTTISERVLRLLTR